MKRLDTRNVYLLAIIGSAILHVFTGQKRPQQFCYLTLIQSFIRFGYEAETKYAQLSEKQMHKDWYYFQNFKMKLYGDRVNHY